MIYHLWSPACFMWWHLMNYWHLLDHYCHLDGKIKQNRVFWQPFCFYVDIWKCPMLTESQQLTCWNWWSKEAKSIKKQTIVNKNKVDWAGCWTTTGSFNSWILWRSWSRQTCKEEQQIGQVVFVCFCFLFVCFVFVLFCFVLFCFVLFCFVLFCFVLFCFVFVLFCFVFVCFLLAYHC